LKILWILLAGLALVTIASIVPGPFSSVLQPSTSPVLEGAGLSPETLGRLQTSCGDCHSGQTRWPIYSRVAPMSWLIRRDVSEGRRFLNFSQWAAYGPEGQSQLLSLAAEKIADGSMPPRRYVLLHGEAGLSGSAASGLQAALQQEAQRVQPKKENK
jgi:hypothetical protein